MSDIVLVRPGVEQGGERRWSQIPPLGLAYLAAHCRAAGLDVRVVDGRMLGHRTPQQTASAALALNPRVVGLSAMTVDFPRALEVAREIKAANGAITTVAGGAHVNAIPRDALAEGADLDVVLAGEVSVELPGLVRALLEGRSPPRTPGLWVRGREPSEGNVAPAFLSQDGIEALPLPAWDLFPRTSTYPIMTQLGCPFRCVFCCHNSTGTMRYRPVERVIDELLWLQRVYHPTDVTFIDENFGLKRERTLVLLEEIARQGLARTIRFSAQTRVDCVSPELAGAMKRAGFDFIELGVESGDAEVLDRSGKHIDLDTLRSAVRCVRSAGLKVWLKFILGLPGEQASTIRRSIELAVELNPDRLSVATIVPYPGSQIYEWARAGTNGYRLISTSWRDFDKYMGNSLALEGLPAFTLRRLQAQMYLETYLRNGRAGELARLLLGRGALVSSYLAGLLRWRRANS